MNARLSIVLCAAVCSACGAEHPHGTVDPPAPDDTAEGAQDEDDTGAPDGLAPTSVQVEPAAIDLGALDPRCPSALELTLTGSGEPAPGGFTVTAPEGWAVDVAEAELASGGSSTVQLSWDGTAADPRGELVFSFEAHEPIVVPLWAEPEIPQERVTVDLGRRADADVLLAVDRSCNMDDMMRLEPHWPVLRSRLADAGISLRMASVVQDSGCVLGNPVVLDDALDDDAFRDALWAQQDWGGNWWNQYSEQLLALSTRALTASCNAELVQASAPLHVVAFSDEPDQSPQDWSVYVDQMALLTDPGVPVTVHGIGKHTDTCAAASWYTGVIEATDATGGVFLDFCTEDWAAALTDLADGMADASRRVVRATLPAHEGEIEAVSTAGEPVTGWTLTDDHIVLPPGADLAGDLTLELRPPPACGE